MSYPTGPEYGAPGTGPAPYGYPARPVRGRRRTLTIAVAALGILNFLLGFAPYDSTDGTEVPGMGTVGAVSGNLFQSGTGGVAAIALLFAAGGLIAGLLTLLFIMINFPDRVDAGIGLILVLFFGFAQATAAVAALVLLDDQ